MREVKDGLWKLHEDRRPNAVKFLLASFPYLTEKQANWVYDRLYQRHTWADVQHWAARAPKDL